MNKNNQILEIVKNKIIAEYANDVSLLVMYGNDKTNVNENLGIRLYFIPKTERGKKLSTQFIVEGVSYDLFPMSWERLIANAAMDRPQGYLLLDTEVIYCSDEEALNRFENLKKSLKLVLSGKYDEALLNKAYEYFNESYIYLYNMDKYKECIGSVKLESAKLLNKISNALAFANRTYYRNSNGSTLKDSLKLEKIPKNYKALVDEIVFSNSSEEIHLKSLSLVENTREFLLNMKKENKQPELFETLFTGYYEELKKSINKCKNALSENDYYKLFELFAYMQEEISQFIAKVEEGIWYDDRNAFVEYKKYFNNIFEVDLLELLSKKDDKEILMAIEKFEENLITLVKKNEIQLLDFDSVKDFESYFK
jgi:hypothetical protein